ncbi:MAG: YcxB family protein [Dysgonamonadaceae bacterium]|jgi:ABC-type multidrug transport system fused ATPase/permease subunit|nr:YcxB family protein [Dysgonamonadaceae bacterium]
MEILFDLTVDDWFIFQQYFRGKSSPVYKLIFPMIITLSLLLLVLTAIQLACYGFHKILWLSVVTFLILLYILYIRKRSMNAIRKKGRSIQEEYPDSFGRKVMKLDKNGFSIATETATKQCAWCEMLEFEETKRYFYLYSNKGVVYIIPKRNVEDPVLLHKLLDNYFQNEL